MHLHRFWFVLPRNGEIIIAEKQLLRVQDRTHIYICHSHCHHTPHLTSLGLTSPHVTSTLPHKIAEIPPLQQTYSTSVISPQ